MTQKASDGFTLGTGNLSLPDLAQPNLTTTVPVIIQSNSVEGSLSTGVFLSDSGGPCVVPCLVTDFTTETTPGSRFWLVSGTHGSSDAEYVYVKDATTGILESGAHGTQHYQLFARVDGEGVAYSRYGTGPAPDPHGKALYLSTSSGRLLEIPYVAGAAGSSEYTPITSDHSKAGNTNAVVGAYNGAATMTLQTSSKACLVNVIS